jgi:hypothetical protein
MQSSHRYGVSSGQASAYTAAGAAVAAVVCKLPAKPRAQSTPTRSTEESVETADPAPGAV